MAQPFSADLKPIVLVFRPPVSASDLYQSRLRYSEVARRTFVNDIAKQIAEIRMCGSWKRLLAGRGRFGAVGVVSFCPRLCYQPFCLQFFKNSELSQFQFLRLRKRKPWGRVINHLTGRPIEGAVVKILDTGFRKVKETQVTDKEGRFGFLVAPGSYLIQVLRSGFGEKETPIFQVADLNHSPNLEISLEALHIGLAEYALRTARFWHWLNLFLDRLSPFTITIGTIASILSALIAPTMLNYAILALYALLILLMTVVKNIAVRSFGRVLSRVTAAPVPLAVVRLYDVKKNWLIGTHVTDESGRFRFLINPGEYYVTAVKNDFSPFTSQPSNFSKSTLLNFDIKLDSVE